MTDRKRLFSLSGEVAMITGGAGYLGSAMADALLAFGAKVAIADIAVADIAGVGDTAKAPSGGGQDGGMAKASVAGGLAGGMAKTSADGGQDGDRMTVYCDVSGTPSIREAMAAVKARFGKLSILINNATYGAGYGPAGTIEGMSDEDWARGLDGAAGTCFRCTREAVPYFKINGGGVIVNIASMYGIVSPDPAIYGASGANNPVNYGAGKAAVLQLTRYCAAHLAPYGIRVNSISPGPFPDPRKQRDEEFLGRLSGKTMLGRIGQAEDIAGAVVYLASSASAFVTGANLAVDGGWTAW